MFFFFFIKIIPTEDFSYPYSEEHHEARSYLRARCPAWCDRILLSHSLKNIVNTEVFIPFLSLSLVSFNIFLSDHSTNL